MSVTFRINFARKANGRRSKTKDPGEGWISLRGNNGCTIIMIHGLTGTPNEMRSLAVHFNREGYSVICPRLANHGDSLEILKKARWQDFYNSVRQVYLTADAEGRGPIFAAGLSMGALLGLLLAGEFPNGISGVCCLAPTLFYDGWNVPLSSRLLPLAYYTPLRHFFYFKEEPPYGIKNERIRQFVHRYYSSARLEDEDMESVARYGYPYFPVTLFHQLHLLAKYLIKRLPHINVPVQLIQAKDDDITSVKNSQFIYDRIGSLTKEIQLLYDSYHIITADQERDKVSRMMGDFFNRIRLGAKP